MKKDIMKKVIAFKKDETHDEYEKYIKMICDEMGLAAINNDWELFFRLKEILDNEMTL